MKIFTRLMFNVVLYDVFFQTIEVIGESPISLKTSAFPVSKETKIMFCLMQIWFGVNLILEIKYWIEEM